MDVDKEEVLAAINGDREALFRAFVWGITTQGHSYWEAQWIGCAPIDVATLREMIGGGEEMETGTPKLWRDMTDEEKGELLLAHQEGKVIEVNTGHGWHDITPVFTDDVAYRVKPEPDPVRERVEFFGSGNPRRYYATFQSSKDTHRITFDVIDGEPDLDSIKMEEL